MCVMCPHSDLLLLQAKAPITPRTFTVRLNTSFFDCARLVVKKMCLLTIYLSIISYHICTHTPHTHTQTHNTFTLDSYIYTCIHCAYTFIHIHTHTYTVHTRCMYRCCSAHIVGCYAPNGEHCERPLEVSIIGTLFMWSV